MRLYAKGWVLNLSVSEYAIPVGIAVYSCRNLSDLPKVILCCINLLLGASILSVVHFSLIIIPIPIQCRLVAFWEVPNGRYY